MMTKSLGILAGSTVALGAINGVLAETTVNADEVRAIVAEMMSDADGRTSMLGADAGHDGKFYLADSSGNFRLNVGGQIQFRYIANFGDEQAPDADDYEGGFQTRRTKLDFGGYVYEPGLFYKVVGAFDRGDGNFALEDAFVGYEIDENTTIRWGQFKLPFLREELVSSKYQLAVDRSLVNEVFNQDRSQGVEISHENDNFRLAGAFSDGFNTDNTDFTAAAESDYAFTGRVEWKAAGTWKQFADFTGAAGQEYGALVGGAIHWEEDDDADFELFTYTLDASVEGDGWNAFGAFVGRSVDTAAGDVDDFGFVVQGGILIPDSDWEVFGRWDTLLPDDDRTNDDDLNTLTIGVNNYMHGHAAKFTLDVQYHIDEAGELSGANTGIGYLADDDDGEFAIRAQFQLLF